MVSDGHNRDFVFSDRFTEHSAIIERMLFLCFFRQVGVKLGVGIRIVVGEKYLILFFFENKIEF